jgi:hypothetical protein
MLELSLAGVIGLAAAYWTALWWMTRHEDVLYGDYVHPGEDSRSRPRPPSPPELPRRPRIARSAPPAPNRALPRATRPSGPDAPNPRSPIVLPAPPTRTPIAAVTHPRGATLAPLPIATPHRPAPVPLAVNPAAWRPAAPTPQPAPNDVLASLLETIKRDLNDAAGK